jgi:hypothetical protein
LHFGQPRSRSGWFASWRRAAELLLDQADVATVSKQVKLALFYDVQLDLKAMD